MPRGIYDHHKIRKPRESRTCAFSDCNTTFEVTVTSTRKYCNKECYWKDKKGRPSWNKDLTKDTDERIAICAKKISKALEGHSVSEETKEKIRVSNSGENNPKYGKTYEEYYGEEKAKEVKRKIGETSEGRKKSPETIERMIKAKKGKTFEEIYGDKAEDMKNNLRIKLTGQHFQTKESKRKIGEASTERWQDEEYRKKCVLAISNAFTLERKKELIERMTGETNPNWVGGVWGDLYPPEFSRIRKQVKERDNNICQLCGKTEEEEIIGNGCGLSVHHVDYDKQNCNEDNLITLCNSCHSTTNCRREFWTEFFRVKLGLIIVV